MNGSSGQKKIEAESKTIMGSLLSKPLRRWTRSQPNMTEKEDSPFSNDNWVLVHVINACITWMAGSSTWFLEKFKHRDGTWPFNCNARYICERTKLLVRMCLLEIYLIQNIHKVSLTQSEGMTWSKCIKIKFHFTRLSPNDYSYSYYKETQTTKTQSSNSNPKHSTSNTNDVV